MFQSLLNCEWIFISQMIYRINQCSSYEEFANVCLCNLKGLFDFSLGVMFQANITDGKPKLHRPYSIDSNSQYFDVNFYIEGNYHPKWTEYFFCPWSSVFRYSDISEESEWTKSRIYKEVLEPLDLYYGLYNTLIYNDTVLGAVVLWRPKAAGDFSPRELFIMDCLKNHLALKFYSLSAGAIKHSKEKEDRNTFLLASFSRKYQLTKREEEIIRLLYLENGTDEICRNLCICPSTLRKHIYNIYKKTGVSSRAKLILLIKT